MLGHAQGTENVCTRSQFRCVFPPSHTSVLFPVNTSIPNVTEVKENMTFGATLVTNPKGGFLVREPRGTGGRGPGGCRGAATSVRQRVTFAFSLFHSSKACGPLYAYRCGHLHYTTGICSDVSPTFQVVNSIAPVRGTGWARARSCPTAWAGRDTHARRRVPERLSCLLHYQHDQFRERLALPIYSQTAQLFLELI